MSFVFGSFTHFPRNLLNFPPFDCFLFPIITGNWEIGICKARISFYYYFILYFVYSTEIKFLYRNHVTHVRTLFLLFQKINKFLWLCCRCGCCCILLSKRNFKYLICFYFLLWCFKFNLSKCKCVCVLLLWHVFMFCQIVLPCHIQIFDVLMIGGKDGKRERESERKSKDQTIHL